MIVHGSSSTFILLIAAGIAQAQTFPLQLEYKATERIRSSAPIALDAELTWNGSGLLKGRLSISLSQSGKTISSVTSRPLVLTGGRNRVQIMLPDVEGRALSEVIELKTRFFPDEGPESIPLGDRSLLVSTEHKRIFRILYCNPFSVTLETDAPALLKSFSIQECWQPPGSTGLTPDTETRTTNQNSAPADQSRGKRIRLRNVSTTIRQSEPVNLSADPHWYCSFNIVVLTRSGFAQLRTPQLTALTQWVQAGGSLLVEPLGVLEERHTRFLNSLVHSPVQSTFSTDLNGTLKLPSDSAFRTLHAELGHVAILHQPLGKNQNYDSQVWKNLLAFLWKFRHEPLNFERRFNNNTGLLTANANGPGPGDLLFSPVQSGDSLLQQLVPEDIRTVPVSYIAVILVVYILAIGPGEYFLLGLINQRHLTWLTFPLLTAGFALFTVWLSNAYLSSASSRFHITVIDVGRDGIPLRDNRFELLYTSSTRDVITEIDRGLFTPIMHARFHRRQVFTFSQQFNVPRFSPRLLSTRELNARRLKAQGKAAGNEPPGVVSPPVLEGRPPGRHQVTQHVPQWTPQINRIFRIHPDNHPPVLVPDKFDWHREWNFQNSQQTAEIRRQVRQQFGQKASLIRFSSGNTGARTTEEIVAASNPSHSFQRSPFGAFLNDLCMRQPESLFRLVSQVAPHGGNNFEDLTLLDITDQTQSLLVILVPEANGLKIYRRLYRNL